MPRRPSSSSSGTTGDPGPSREDERPRSRAASSGIAAVGGARFGDGDQDGDVPSGPSELAGRGKRGLAVEHDPDGRSGTGRPGGELGVVGQDRADPDEDGVHPAPELVDQRAGTLREEIHWLSPDATAVLPSRVMAHLAVT